MKRLVYIAGPITNGGAAYNWRAIRLAVQAAFDLEKLGYATHCPQMFVGFAEALNIPWESWVESGKAWVAVSDAVLRIPGESKGADEECNTARIEMIPVFDSVEELDAHYRKGQTCNGE